MYFSNKLRVLTAVFLSLCAAHPAFSQSQPRWCSSSELNPTEATICNTATLGALDIDMSGRYFEIVDGVSDTDKRLMRKDQSAWLKWRNECRTDTACLVRRYGYRIAELGGAPVGFGSIDGEIVSKKFVNGKVETVYADGRIARLGPTDIQADIEYPEDWDGPIQATIMAVLVQPNYPPVLPSGFSDWGNTLERNLGQIVGGLISPDEMTQFSALIESKDYTYRIFDHLFIIENMTK
jgi:uncharacterized protein